MRASEENNCGSLAVISEIEKELQCRIKIAFFLKFHSFFELFETRILLTEDFYGTIRNLLVIKDLFFLPYMKGGGKTFNVLPGMRFTLVCIILT